MTKAERKELHAWFECGVYYDMVLVYNNDALLAKYWVAGELATGIIAEYEDLIDEELYIFAASTKTSHKNHLTQVLKKELFR